MAKKNANNQQFVNSITVNGVEFFAPRPQDVAELVEKIRAKRRNDDLHFARESKLTGVEFRDFMRASIEAANAFTLASEDDIRTVLSDLTLLELVLVHMSRGKLVLGAWKREFGDQYLDMLMSVFEQIRQLQAPDPARPTPTPHGS